MPFLLRVSRLYGEKPASTHSWKRSNSAVFPVVVALSCARVRASASSRSIYSCDRPYLRATVRERHEDIPVLAEHFLRHSCDRNKLPLKRLAPETLRLLIAAPWPGNVRELEHTIERAVLFSPGPDIQPQSIAFGSPTGGALALPTAVNLSHARALLDSAEREKLQGALAQARGNRSRAAKLLGISRSTLYERLKRYASNSKL